MLGYFSVHIWYSSLPSLAWYRSSKLAMCSFVSVVSLICSHSSVLVVYSSSLHPLALFLASHMVLGLIFAFPCKFFSLSSILFVSASSIRFLSFFWLSRYSFLYLFYFLRYQICMLFGICHAFLSLFSVLLWFFCCWLLFFLFLLCFPVSPWLVFFFGFFVCSSHNLVFVYL